MCETQLRPRTRSLSLLAVVLAVSGPAGAQDVTPCVQFGGTCAEACAPDQTPEPRRSCADALVCCMPQALLSPYPPAEYLVCAGDDECALSDAADLL
jgi:hypothetical protein